MRAAPEPPVARSPDIDRVVALAGEGAPLDSLIVGSNSVCMDFLSGMTSPSALQAWASDWSVGGQSYTPGDERQFSGKLSFVKSAFFKLRLQGDQALLDEFLKTVADELSSYGQWIVRDVNPDTSEKRFAATERSFSGAALGAAMLRAGWDRVAIKLWISSIGAKLELVDFLGRANSAAVHHEFDVGAADAALFEQNFVVDIGQDFKTQHPVVVSPEYALLRQYPFSGAECSIMPMWGVLGGGKGGVMMRNLAGPFSLLKVYNKHVSQWRAGAGSGFTLGREALFKNANVEYLTTIFKNAMSTGLNMLEFGSALSWTRVEVRRTVGSRFADQTWADEATRALAVMKAALVCSEIPRADILSQALAAHETASATGLFHDLDHRVDPEWRSRRISAVNHRDGNRLAYRIGWVFAKRLREILALEDTNANWGPAVEDADAPAMDPGFVLSPDLQLTAAPDLTAFDFTNEAHRLARDVIDWGAVSGGVPEIAEEMRRVAMLMRWSLFRTRDRLPKFRIYYLSRESGATKGWVHLEEAVLELLMPPKWDLSELQTFDR